MRALAIAVLCAACTNNSSSDHAVACLPPTISTRVVSGQNVCDLDFGVCDETPYALRCDEISELNVPELDCSCEIDGVIGGVTTTVRLTNATCANAGTLTADRFEYAWMDCGINLTIGAQ